MSHPLAPVLADLYTAAAALLDETRLTGMTGALACAVMGTPDRGERVYERACRGLAYFLSGDADGSADVPGDPQAWAALLSGAAKWAGQGCPTPTISPLGEVIPAQRRPTGRTLAHIGGKTRD